MNLKFVSRLVLLGWFVAASVHAADIYVAPNGNDSNPGTKDQPFGTLERARDEVRALIRHGPLKKRASPFGRTVVNIIWRNLLN
jgi:hypothetical protein